MPISLLGNAFYKKGAPILQSRNSISTNIITNHSYFSRLFVFLTAVYSLEAVLPNRHNFSQNGIVIYRLKVEYFAGGGVSHHYILLISPPLEAFSRFSDKQAVCMM